MILVTEVVAGCGHAVEPRRPFDDGTQVPAPRSLLIRFDLQQGMTLTWQATAVDRTIVDGWTVERRTSTESAFTRLTAGAMRDTVFVDPGLGDGVRAIYRVRGVTAAGVASPAAETAPTRADLVAPAPPGNIAANTSTEGIDVTFTRGPESDVAFFEVRLLELSPGNSLEFRSVADSPGLITGLIAGALYQVDVAAVDSAGRQSAFSTPPASAVAGP
jgi:hypothetical protein